MSAKVLLVAGLIIAGGIVSVTARPSQAVSFMLNEDNANGGKAEKNRPRVALFTRFFVPPHGGKDFEHAWLQLADAVEKDGDADAFDLSKTASDNLVYTSYSEWSHEKDVESHLSKVAFEDFIKAVDDLDVYWELNILRTVDRDDEADEEDNKKKKQKKKRDDEGGEPDWDKYIPEDYRHYIPDSARPGHKDRGHGRGGRGDFVDSQSSTLASDTLGRRSEQPGQAEQDDWEKYIPEDQRGYIPGARHHHKKKKNSKGWYAHSSRNELGAEVLATLPNNGLDADETVLRQLWLSKSKAKDTFQIVEIFFVPLGEEDAFLDVWSDHAQESRKDKGNLIFALRKSVTDNTRFVGYSSWSSLRAFLDHKAEEHTRVHLELLAERDIVFKSAPLKHVGGINRNKVQSVV